MPNCIYLLVIIRPDASEGCVSQWHGAHLPTHIQQIGTEALKDFATKTYQYLVKEEEK